MTIITLEHFQNLGEKINEMVLKYDIEYIDAVLSYCEAYNLEIETIGEIIAQNPDLKLKVELEAETLHFLKKEDRLPV